MHPLAVLLASTGTWHATYCLRDPENHLSADCDSRAIVTPMLGGRLARLDYTWSYRGKPQEGSLIIGCEPASGLVTAAWADTWHNGDRIMACTGTIGADGVITLRGTYAAPPGPDWGWRTDLRAAADRLHLQMFNVSPSGHEELAVDAEYRKGPRE